MPKGLSATQRTLRALEQRGCHCGIVERFNRFVGPHGKRIDLFNIIDLIALYPNSICGVQCCSGAFAQHDRKILENEMAKAWLESGGTLELWSWRKLKKVRGGKQMVWQPKVKRYCLEDFE